MIFATLALLAATEVRRVDMGAAFRAEYERTRADVDLEAYPGPVRVLFPDGTRLWYAHGAYMYYLDLNTEIVTTVGHTLMSHANSVVRSGTSTLYMCGYDGTSGNRELRAFSYDYDTQTVTPGTTVTIAANTNNAYVSQCSVDADGNVLYYNNGGGIWIYRVADGTLHDLQGTTGASLFRTSGDALLHPYGDRILQCEVFDDWLYAKGLAYDGATSAYGVTSVLGQTKFQVAPRGLGVDASGRYAITSRQTTSLAFVVDVFATTQTASTMSDGILMAIDVCPGIGCVDDSLSESECVGHTNLISRTWSATLGGCKIHGQVAGKSLQSQSNCEASGYTWTDAGTDRGACTSTNAGVEASAFYLDPDNRRFWMVQSAQLYSVTDVGTFVEIAAAPPAPPPSASALQDPHIVYPNGARTDVRGFDGALLNYVSFPGLTVNVRTENATFRLGNATIHGSFLTELHVHASASDATRRKDFEMSHVAARATDGMWGWDMVSSSCGGNRYNVLPHGGRTCGDVRVDVDAASSHFHGHGWTVHATVLPVYGRLEGCSRRLDVRVEYDGANAAEAHGILGQGFARGDRQRHGRRDVYPARGEYVTSAQGEGAIEGDVRDYVVATPYAPAPVHDRFGWTVARGAEKRGSRLVATS